MILAPNLRLPLNGNKPIWLLLLCFFLGSCELFQKMEKTADGEDEEEELPEIQGTRVYDPDRREWVVVEQAPSEEMDTIRWKDIPERSYPPITAGGESGRDRDNRPIGVGEHGTEFLSTYKGVMLLPFLGNRFNQTTGDINENSRWALKFFAGAKLAIQDLESEGLRMNLTVMDTKGSARETRRLLNSREALEEADLIIGPYLRDNIRQVARFAKSENITMVSPYSAASDLAERNPFYVQVSPTLERHCKSLFRHARSKYRPEQIVLVSQDVPQEKSRLEYFREAYREYEGRRKVDPLQEYIVAGVGEKYDNLEVMPFVKLQDTTVFMVPSWDETFVYTLMRKADIARSQSMNEGREPVIVVYGMPQWMEFEYIDLDYYEKLNVHISSNYYLDRLAPRVQFFRERYYDQFGDIATIEAFLGYDVMLYFGRMLEKHGTRFQYFLEGEEDQYLHTRFEFERVVEPTTTGVEDPPIERFENKYVNILKFEDYQFILTDQEKE